MLACIYDVAEGAMRTMHDSPWPLMKVLFVYEFAQEILDVLEVARLGNSIVVASVRQFSPDLGSFADLEQSGHV
jgi:hypothetical protein